MDHRSVSGSSAGGGGGWCTCFFVLGLVALVVAAAAFVVTLPDVSATVTHASLASLDHGTTSNSTTAAASSASVAYNLSLTVKLRNHNWALSMDLTAPLDAELRFAGRRFARARLADPGMSFPPRGAKEFRVLAALSPAAARAAAELARERAGAVLQVELRIAGKVRYRPVHIGGSRLEVTCPLKLLMPNAPLGAHNMTVLPNGAAICY